MEERVRTPERRVVDHRQVPDVVRRDPERQCNERPKKWEARGPRGKVARHDDGKYFTMERVRLWTLPEKPAPIYVATAGPVTAKWTGENCDGFITPGASIEKDFAWSPVHPVVDAYRANQAMPYDAPASALAATLYAVKPDEPYFKLSDPGTITVLDDGRTKFTPAADGKHRYLMVDPAQKEQIVALYTALVSAQPAPRPGRGRGGV